MDFTRIKNLVKKNGDKFILIENGEPEMVILPFSEYEKMMHEDTDIRWDSDEKQAIEDDLDLSSAGEMPEEKTEEKTNDADAKTNDTLNDFISEVYKGNAMDDFKDLRGVMGEREAKDGASFPPHEFGSVASAGEKESLSDEEIDFRPESVRLEDLPI